jgi:hypothetical protein
MVAEGSVVLAGSRPRGAAHDVAPAGFAHPVYRSGFALAVALPWKSAEDRPVAPLAETSRPAPASTATEAPVTPATEAELPEPSIEVVPVDEAAPGEEMASLKVSAEQNEAGEGI